jgi:hypothetical protein
MLFAWEVTHHRYSRKLILMYLAGVALVYFSLLVLLWFIGNQGAGTLGFLGIWMMAKNLPRKNKRLDNLDAKKRSPNPYRTGLL